MKSADVEELADVLGRTLAAIDAGQLDAPAVMRERIVGGLVVLRIVLGDSPEDVLAALSADPT